ncbi:hypothetical protein DALLNEIH_03659 [Bacillus sp. B01(2024)]|uniref:hypothetical protein n=1 Tax=Bacillus siamensis TaxID=659243 RepID=UPI0039DFEAC0
MKKIDSANEIEKDVSFHYTVKDKDGIFPKIGGVTTASSAEKAKNELLEYYAYELDTAPEALEITLSPSK